MVSSYLPYPLFNGGNIRLYNLLKHLSKKNQITLICEKRNYQTQIDINEVKKFCKEVITVPRKKQWSLSNILKSTFSLNPFLLVGHTNPEMKKAIERSLIENHFDLIHIETFYVFQNLPSTELPVVLVEHNIEYLVYKRYVDQSPFWLRPFLNLDIRKLKIKENYFWRKATKLVAVASSEKEIMDQNSTIVPNGVDIEKFKFKNPKEKIGEKEKLILFIGDFKWIENRDSIEWILKKIWPKINQQFNIKLWVVGREIPESIKKMETKNVIFDENVLNTQKAYEKSYILLSPIKVGGGTSFKILEAMASGVPVVTTTLGASGITDGSELISADSDKEIVDKVEELLLNPTLYEKTSQKARKLAEERFNWESIAVKLEKVYMEVLYG